jgi:hypothetical protein
MVMKNKKLRQKSNSIIANAASQKATANGKGVIRVDTGMLQLPKGFVEEQKGGDGSIDRVVVVILSLAVIFIIFITYLISITPPKLPQN